MPDINLVTQNISEDDLGNISMERNGKQNIGKEGGDPTFSSDIHLGFHLGKVHVRIDQNAST